MKYILTLMLLLVPCTILADEPDEKDRKIETLTKRVKFLEENDPSKIEALHKRIDGLEKQVLVNKINYDETRRLEYKVYELTAMVNVLARRIKLYEEDDKAPWERGYFRDMRKEFKDFPLMRAMDQVTDAVDDVLDEDDTDDSDEEEERPKKKRKQEIDE